MIYFFLFPWVFPNKWNLRKQIFHNIFGTMFNFLMSYLHVHYKTGTAPAYMVIWIVDMCMTLKQFKHNNGFPFMWAAYIVCKKVKLVYFLSHLHCLTVSSLMDAVELICFTSIASPLELVLRVPWHSLLLLTISLMSFDIAIPVNTSDP